MTNYISSWAMYIILMIANFFGLYDTSYLNNPYYYLEKAHYWFELYQGNDIRAEVYTLVLSPNMTPRHPLDNDMLYILITNDTERGINIRSYILHKDVFDGRTWRDMPMTDPDRQMSGAMFGDGHWIPSGSQRMVGFRIDHHMPIEAGTYRIRLGMEYFWSDYPTDSLSLDRLEWKWDQIFQPVLPIGFMWPHERYIVRYYLTTTFAWTN